MTIDRFIIDELKQWKSAVRRKPLLLKGARQIGKTWVMRQFGNECYKHTAFFDFDRQSELKTLFASTKEPKRILSELTLYCEVPIIPDETLIIFDEIQECEEAFNALKYFADEAPEYHIIAAGSLLGVAVRKRRMTVPVGKVKVMRMYPLTFMEFLKSSDLATYNWVTSLNELSQLPLIILNKLKSEYRRYQVCGGMPEAAVHLLDNDGITAVDDALQDILDMYELDFARYAEPREIPRIHSLWHSLPAQLSSENRKFIYKRIKQGARSKDYEDALMWLEDAGMIYKINNVTKPGIPFDAYADQSAFKIYVCDCGLLRKLANLRAEAILEPISNFTEFKGALAENTILQNLLPVLKTNMPHYWTSDYQAEVEFIIQIGTEVVPIEVKAENCISGRSLAIYNGKYNPSLRFRFSMLNYRKDDNLVNCPSPLAELLLKSLILR